MGTPLSRWGNFGAAGQPRLAARRQPPSDPNPHVTGGAFSRLAVGAESGHHSSLLCPLTTPTGKVFQPRFSLFHLRLRRVPRARSPSKGCFLAHTSRRVPSG